MTKPYTDADIAQLAATVRARIGWPISAGEAGTVVTIVLQELATTHRLAATAPAPTNEQVRAGADALVRLRTQAPSLSELADDEQECWLADARAVLEAAGPLAPVDDDPRHIIEFRTDGWTIKHPLSCRIGDLFGCRVNLAAEDLGRPPYLGRYEASVSDIDGRLQLGDRVDPVEG